VESSKEESEEWNVESSNRIN